MLMILARLVRSESFWAVVKVRSPHTGPEVSYPRTVERIKESVCSGRQLHHSPLLQSAVYTQVLVLSE